MRFTAIVNVLLVSGGVILVINWAILICWSIEVRHKLNFGFEDMSEQTVKNIASRSGPPPRAQRCADLN